MKFETYNRHDTFAVKLNQQSAENIITIWEPQQDPLEVALLNNATHVIRNGLITALRIKAKVPSIPEADLPQLAVDQSRTERLNLTRNYEWTSPRKHLNLWLKTSGGNWANIATISITNIPPFRVFDLSSYFTSDIAIALGANGAIGLSVENAGYGLLEGNDEILCSGLATTEVVVIPEEVEPISQSFNYGEAIDSTSRVFIPAIPNKKQVTLTNMGNSNVFLSIGQHAEIGKGIALRANGGSYEFNRSNHPFNLPIYAVSDGSSLLSGIVAI